MFSGYTVVSPPRSATQQTLQGENCDCELVSNARAIDRRCRDRAARLCGKG